MFSSDTHALLVLVSRTPAPSLVFTVPDGHTMYSSQFLPRQPMLQVCLCAYFAGDLVLQHSGMFADLICAVPCLVMPDFTRTLQYFNTAFTVVQSNQSNLLFKSSNRRKTRTYSNYATGPQHVARTFFPSWPSKWCVAAIFLRLKC